MNKAIVSRKEQDIRKIEDIIDIQKAKGSSIGVKQVAFSLPSEAASTVSVSFARSLESGLPKVDDSNAFANKKKKRLQSKRQKSPCPDLSWPSGSDVTVLRLKLNLNTDIKENIATLAPGDGLHLPDSSSMVNLATLLQPPSSCLECMNVEEYLLPLSSWEHGTEYNKDFSEELKTCTDPIIAKPDNGLATCTRHDEVEEPETQIDTRLAEYKLSKFTKLMMNFCSCCSWPVNEKITETPYMNTSSEEIRYNTT